MAIGNWGSNITFEVSASRALTFKDMTRNVSGRWQDHPILDGKPLSEFGGAELSSVTMTVILSAMNGVHPKDVIASLEAAAENGKVDYLYIGGRKIGTDKMRLTSVSESWNKVMNNGALVEATVDLTFDEYISISTMAGKNLAGTKVPWEYVVGDEVTFLGGRYWKKATAKGKGKKAKKGPAKVTAYKKKKKHPYKLKTKNKKKTKVNGWVNEGSFT